VVSIAGHLQKQQLRSTGDALIVTKPRSAEHPGSNCRQRGKLQVTSRAFPKFESYAMLEMAASVGRKVKDAIVWFHGIGRLGDP